MVTMDISLPVIALAKSVAKEEAEKMSQDLITDEELEMVKEKLETINN